MSHFITLIFNLQSFCNQSVTFYHRSLLFNLIVAFYPSAVKLTIALLLSLQCLARPSINFWFHPLSTRTSI